MTRTGKHPVLRSGATAALLAVLLACAASCGTGEDTRSAAESQLWIANGDQLAAYDPDTGLILAIAGNAETPAIVGLNPSTGGQAWSTPTGAEPLVEVLADGPLAVAETSSGGSTPATFNGSPPTIWILDARSGDELDSIDLPTSAALTSVTDGQIIVSNGNTLFAYSAGTGQIRWQKAVPPRCTLKQAAGTAEILGIVVECAGGTLTLDDVAPSNGRYLWTRTVSHDYSSLDSGGEDLAQDPAPLSAEQDTLAISEGSIFSSDGRLLRTGPACEWYTLDGTQLITASESQAGDLAVTETSLRTGIAKAIFVQPYEFASAQVAGNVLYLIAAPTGPVLPAVLVEINLATGAYSQFATQFNGADVPDYQIESSVFYVGGSLIVEPVTGTAAAYRLPAPGRVRDSSWIQGAAAGKWPSACSLLSAADIEKAAQKAYYAIPLKETTSRDAPDASTCVYAPDDSRLPVITIDIAWKSLTQAAAEALLASSAAKMRSLPGIGAQAYLCGAFTSCSWPTGQQEVLMRAKTTIVTIKFSMPFGAPEAIAQDVGDSLEREVGNV